MSKLSCKFDLTSLLELQIRSEQYEEMVRNIMPRVIINAISGGFQNVGTQVFGICNLLPQGTDNPSLFVTKACSHPRVHRCMEVARYLSKNPLFGLHL